VPNACSTLALPTGAFEFDLSPGSLGNAEDRGDLVVTDDPLG
jgi:formamidase